MRKNGHARGFVTGLIVGLLIGSVSVSIAAVGYKAWSRVSPDYRMGYVNGYFDMAMLARNLHPGGFVDERYPVFPQARARDWVEAVDKAYQNPANQKYSMYSILQVAAGELEKKFGKPPTPLERLAPRLKQQLEGAREHTELMQKQKRTAAAKPAAPVVPKPPKKKIWCKCAEMEKACPELAKEFTTRKPKDAAAPKADPSPDEPPVDEKPGADTGKPADSAKPSAPATPPKP
ncbi:MAG TPA: hypothetical protein VEC57_17760 [Candidatus Limnocylindrales bacterium]|nr:hypothetical protein [Candidatus Limnocylindrales bacterium]